MKVFFDYNKFLERFVTLLDEDARTDCEIAKELGISRDVLSKYKKGTNRVKLDTVANMAQLYNVSTDYLLGLSDIKTTELLTRDICNETGLSENSVANIKFICKKMEPVNKKLKSFRPLWVDFLPSFTDNFSSQKIANAIMEEKELTKSVVTYLQKYTMLYTLSHGFNRLPPESDYKVVDNDAETDLREENAFNFYMATKEFERLIEKAAQRIIEDIDLSSEEAAKKAGVLPPDTRLENRYNYSVAVDDDCFGIEEGGIEWPTFKNDEIEMEN